MHFVKDRHAFSSAFADLLAWIPLVIKVATKTFDFLFSGDGRAVLEFKGSRFAKG